MSDTREPSLFDRPDAEFKLSITRALADQLETALRALTPAPLTEDMIASLSPVPGIYQLFDGEELVYVGKASKSLVQRLSKHLVKLAGRGVEGIRFDCLYVDEDLEASAPEKMLIRRYKESGLAVWNTNGFGNNDPGAKRDLTAVKINHFDKLHPIDLDYSIELSQDAVKKGTVAAALKDIKKRAPYLLRFQKTTPTVLGKARLSGSGVSTRSVAEWIPRIVEALPEGWQATALPGYVILYEVSDPSQYLSSTRYWRKENGHVIDVTTEPTWGAAEEIQEKAEEDEPHDEDPE